MVFSLCDGGPTWPRSPLGRSWTRDLDTPAEVHSAVTGRSAHYVGAISSRNPHAGHPFVDDDSAIAAALAEVNVPALLCSLVSMTGDPIWVREWPLPQMATAMDFQCGLSEADQGEIRR